MKFIAVLLTSYNRVNKTLECLKALHNVEVPNGFYYDVYLVDDASPDKTGMHVKEKFPAVNVIQGTGKLYWCGGMRLAWETAAKTKEYDFYLWLNDDTILYETALIIIYNDYNNIKNKFNSSLVAICGACKEPNFKKVSYSGSNSLEPVTCLSPNGQIKKCRFINGNIALFPKDVFNVIGGLSEKIKHRFADYEYSARINKYGGQCFVSSEYVASCYNEVFKCFNPEVKFFKRLKLFFSPVGLSLCDDIYFKIKYNNRKWLAWVCSTLRKCLMVLFPRLYTKIKNLIK